MSLRTWEGAVESVTEPLTVREAARRRHPLDGADAQALEAALSGVEELLGELLANIHRDGGHHRARHGLEASCREAHREVLRLRAVIDAESLRHVVLGAAVLRATCSKHVVDESFRVHLREQDWDRIVALAGER